MPRRPRNPSGFVRKHPDTASLRWQGVVKYWDTDEARWRQRSATFGGEAEAKAWVAAAVMEHRKTPGYRPSATETFGAYLARWLNDVAGGRLRDPTLAAYRRYAQPLIRQCGQQRLADITPMDLQSTYAAMRRAGYRRTRRATPWATAVALCALAVVAGCSASGHLHQAAPSVRSPVALRPLNTGPISDVLFNTGVRRRLRHSGYVGRIPAQSAPYTIDAVCSGPGTIRVGTTSAGTFSMPCNNKPQGVAVTLSTEYSVSQTVSVLVSYRATWHIIAIGGPLP